MTQIKKKKTKSSNRINKNFVRAGGYQKTIGLTKEMYYMIAVDPRSLKSRCGWGPLKPVRQSFLPLPSFWQFVENLWPSSCCNCLTPNCLCCHVFCVSLCLYKTIFEDTGHIVLGAHPTPV